MLQLRAERKELEYLLTLLSEDNILYKRIKRVLTPIKVSSRKQKGRNLEQWGCEQISELINIPYDPKDDSSLINYRRMGQSGVDIILIGKAQEKFPYCIECKASESLNLTETIAQAQSNIKEGYDWMIVHKRKILNEPI